MGRCGSRSPSPFCSTGARPSSYCVILQPARLRARTGSHLVRTGPPHVRGKHVNWPLLASCGPSPGGSRGRSPRSRSTRCPSARRIAGTPSACAAHRAALPTRTAPPAPQGPARRSARTRSARTGGGPPASGACGHPPAPVRGAATSRRFIASASPDASASVRIPSSASASTGRFSRLRTAAARWARRPSGSPRRRSRGRGPSARPGAPLRAFGSGE